MARTGGVFRASASDSAAGKVWQLPFIYKKSIIGTSIMQKDAAQPAPMPAGRMAAGAAARVPYAFTERGQAV